MNAVAMEETARVVFDAFQPDINLFALRDLSKSLHERFDVDDQQVAHRCIARFNLIKFAAKRLAHCPNVNKNAQIRQAFWFHPVEPSRQALRKRPTPEDQIVIFAAFGDKAVAAVTSDNRFCDSALMRCRDFRDAL